MKNQAVEAMPTIEKRLNEMTDGISTNVNKVIESISNTSWELSSNVEKLVENVSTSSEKVQNAITNQLKDLDDVAKSFRDSFNDAIEESSKRLETRLDRLDKEMESEVKRVVELMGGKLSSLSNQFVQDYTPLTNELKKLINISNRSKKSKEE